jgi:hypothetical protein
MFDPTGPTCRAPQALTKTNPVNGRKTYSSAYLMRVAEEKPRCGIEALWFLPKQAPVTLKSEKYVSFFDRWISK